MVGPARAPRHALGDALAEAFLDGLEAHPTSLTPCTTMQAPTCSQGTSTSLGSEQVLSTALPWAMICGGLG
jgi:hypothetical protein